MKSRSNEADNSSRPCSKNAVGLSSIVVGPSSAMTLASLTPGAVRKLRLTRDASDGVAWASN